MDAHTLSSVLKKPSLLRNYPMIELELLGQQHPYTSLINALIAIKAHHENNSGYEHYLNQAAIRVPDRKRLYYLIHSESAEPEVSAEPAELLNHAISPVELPERIAPLKEEKPEPESLIKVSTPEMQGPVTENKKKIEVPEQLEGDAPIDLPGMDEAVAALKTIGERESQPAAELPVKRAEKQEAKEEMVSKKHSFTEWLSFIGQEQGVVKKTPVQKEMDSTGKDEIKIFKDVELTEAEEATIKQKAKESLSDDLEWVTETLAKIYELQKKYDKAEEAYKMLSLKYPDKKAYFAQRIENLKRRFSQ